MMRGLSNQLSGSTVTGEYQTARKELEKILVEIDLSISD